KVCRSKIEENTNQARQVDYYARQTRIGRVYLDLFARLRAETPADTQVTFFGPSSEAAASGRSGREGGEELNPSDLVRDIVVRGQYDTDTYPGTKFNDAFEVMRKKLLDIPGVANMTLADKDIPN